MLLLENPKIKEPGTRLPDRRPVEMLKMKIAPYSLLITKGQNKCSLWLIENK
jgi:hypothetical protein